MKPTTGYIYDITSNSKNSNVLAQDGVNELPPHLFLNSNIIIRCQIAGLFNPKFASNSDIII